MLSLFFMLLVIGSAAAHGRLVNPAGRNSMWRFGYNNPPNYDDTALFCGGRAHQWEKLGGQCGICGDPYDQVPRPHEGKGKYANGVITGSYKQGQMMTIYLQVTANHGGFFEFRLCPLGRFVEEASVGCLNRNLLELADGSKKFVLREPKIARNFSISVKLPEKMSCERCVLQWKWNTGNSWACDNKNNCCIGCGPQEQFINCADITIRPIIRIPSVFLPKKKANPKPRPATSHFKKTIVYGQVNKKPTPVRRPVSQSMSSAGYSSWRKPTAVTSVGSQTVRRQSQNRPPNKYTNYSPPSGFSPQLPSANNGAGRWTNSGQNIKNIGSTHSTNGQRSMEALTRDILAELTHSSSGGVVGGASSRVCRPKYANYSVDCTRTCIPKGRELCSARREDVRVNVACLLLCEPKN